jgi:hypothetical protein
MAPAGAHLAEIEQHVVQARGAQQRRDAIGHIALRDAVQGQPHAGRRSAMRSLATSTLR